MKTLRFVDPSLDIAMVELNKAIEWRDRSLNSVGLSNHLRRLLRSVMRRHALDSRRSFAGQLLYAGADPRNVGDLPLASLWRSRKEHHKP